MVDCDISFRGVTRKIHVLRADQRRDHPPRGARAQLPVRQPDERGTQGDAPSYLDIVRDHQREYGSSGAEQRDGKQPPGISACNTYGNLALLKMRGLEMSPMSRCANKPTSPYGIASIKQECSFVSLS